MTDLLPKAIQRLRIPPIKCQGIKTKLVGFIAANINWAGEGRWIEPFLGTGVVALNIQPQRALLADTNRHIIGFYQSIQSGQITEGHVRDHLRGLGQQLRAQGGDFFYEVRKRFNETSDPLDLLFLNRSCFNGVMRFNRKGGYNVPFGKKPERFCKSYVTKICNQIKWLRHTLRETNWVFQCADWRQTLSESRPDDFVYVDPPYIGRHTDYFNSWTDDDARDLAKLCGQLPCGFALSMWKENKYRRNSHIDECWSQCVVRTQSHFYHVGPSEDLRNEMTEALVIRDGYASPTDTATSDESEQPAGRDQQLTLFE